jgi:TRAP-type uncharacterized transport system fused permease subunit
VVTLAAPALLQLGVPPLATHFMVFYGAILAGITPPVAGIAVIASSIAKSSYFKTCWAAMRLSVALFILPLVFVLHPEILAANASAVPMFLRCLVGFSAVAYGTWATASGVQGYVIRVLAFLCGIAVVLSWQTPVVVIAGLAGIGIIAAVLIVQYKKSGVQTA